MIARTLVLATTLVVVLLLARLVQQQRALPTIANEPQSESDLHSEAAVAGNGLPIGTPAPDFLLRDLDDRQVSLADLLQNGNPTMLLFMSPSCGPCESLLEDVERWDREHSDSLKFAVISASSRAESLKEFKDRSIGCVLVNGLEVGDAYDVQLTPSAILVDTNRTVGSLFANNSEAIKSLVLSKTNRR